MTNETAVLDEVLNATSLMHLEGADGKKPNRVFLMYARKVHPDMFQDDALKAKAEKAMAHLTVLKEQGEGKVSGPSASKPRANKNVVRTKKHTYELKHIGFGVVDITESHRSAVVPSDAGALRNDTASLSALPRPVTAAIVLDVARIDGCLNAAAAFKWLLKNRLPLRSLLTCHSPGGGG